MIEHFGEEVPKESNVWRQIWNCKSVGQIQNDFAAIDKDCCLQEQIGGLDEVPVTVHQILRQE